MFSNLQIRPARSHRRKPSLTNRAGVTKRRVSTVSAAAASNVPSLSLMENLFGAEFPEAFATNSGRGRASRKTILDLPSELLSLTCDYLSKLDIKRLRLVSHYLAANVDLRIDRVFISPNLANLACLEWVLEHPRHSNRVREIVWDDAQLEEYPTLEGFRQAIAADDWQWTRKIEDRLELATDSDEDHPLERDDFFHKDGRLNDAAKNILLGFDDKLSLAILVRNATAMSVEDSYPLYRRLYQEEQDLMKRRVDVAAFEQALRSLPNLKRITLTSEAWRPWQFMPHYDTPYRRSLPVGFRKPTVWPWHGLRPATTPAQEEDSVKALSTPLDGCLPNDWRGYTIVTSALLSQSNVQIEEFVIDAGCEPTGINHQLFAHPNKDLERTKQFFRGSPLQRLQFVINENILYETASIFDHLKHALSELRYLTHLDLRITSCDTRCMYMEEILPPHLPAQLKIFAFRGFSVVGPSLATYLQQLVNAQQIVLEDIWLQTDYESDYSLDDSDVEALFQKLRTYYTEHELDASISRPIYTWMEKCGHRQYFFYRYRLIQEELNDFLYRGWDCPFLGDEIYETVGWVVDGRDPDYKERAAKVLHRTKVEDDAMWSDPWLSLSYYR
ncbi:hypothetical protein NX059_000759 [Plenodomus lindquistii]|nr:hypothetical protein NX059_000759 [Plenodomus lindquistii]